MRSRGIFFEQRDDAVAAGSSPKGGKLETEHRRCDDDVCEWEYPLGVLSVSLENFDSSMYCPSLSTISTSSVRSDANEIISLIPSGTSLQPISSKINEKCSSLIDVSLPPNTGSSNPKPETCRISCLWCRVGAMTTLSSVSVSLLIVVDVSSSGSTSSVVGGKKPLERRLFRDDVDADAKLSGIVLPVRVLLFLYLLVLPSSFVLFCAKNGAEERVVGIFLLSESIVCGCSDYFAMPFRLIIYSRSLTIARTR